MFPAATAHDSRYADFASRMLAAEASEAASIAALNARMTLHTPVQGATDGATVRPAKNT